MKRNLMICAALAMLALMSSSALASPRVARKASHVKRPFVAARVATQAGGCDPSTCDWGSCSMLKSTSARSTGRGAATAKLKPANAGGACPVSDPSACPSSCSRSGAAAAVASAVR